LLIELAMLLLLSSRLLVKAYEYVGVTLSVEARGDAFAGHSHLNFSTFSTFASIEILQVSMSFFVADQFTFRGI